MGSRAELLSVFFLVFVLVGCRSEPKDPHEDLPTYDYRFRIQNEEAKFAKYTIQQYGDMKTMVGLAAYVTVKEGPFALQIEADGFETQLVNYTAPIPKEQIQVSEKNDPEVFIRLEEVEEVEHEIPQREIKVRVTGPPDYAPARVGLFGPGTVSQALDNSPTFEVDYDGEYTLVVEGLNFKKEEVKFEVPGEQTEFEFELIKNEGYDAWFEARTRNQLRKETKDKLPTTLGRQFNASAPRAKAQAPAAKREGGLSQPTIMATSKSVLSEIGDDRDVFLSHAGEGNAFLLYSGTEFEVLNPGFLYTRILVLSGGNRGRKGFVVSEAVGAR